jgi:maltodextrin utilization protein YvdJ
MDQWLNACVAIERAYTIIKGPRFIKKKSKLAAKFVIILLVIVLVGTSIHDPISRGLIDEQSNDDDDDNVKRTWCIVNYGSVLQVYNSMINTIHFLGPFMINLISSIILITKKSRQQAKIHKQRSYKEILIEQFKQNKHLLTAPIVLVILAFPRLIITFVSKCMKSSNDSWLFLVGYFISFIPPMLTYIVFILPSKFYKKEFRKSVTQFRTTIERRLRLTS